MAAQTKTAKKAGAKKAAAPRGRGSIQARGADKWLVRVFVGTDPATGKRKYTSEVVGGSRKDAEKALTRILAGMDTGTFVEPARQTLREFLAGWLAGEGRQRSARTRMDYEKSLGRYILPELGAFRLDKLTPYDVQQVVNRMSARDLAPHTIRLALAPLRCALNRAVDLGLLARNPADRRVRIPTVERKERQTLSPTQVDCLLAATSGTKTHALWSVLLGTGLRPQEALALKWSDVEGSTIRVRRALSQVAPGKYEVADTKTFKSARALTVPLETLAAIEAHRSLQVAEMLKGGTRFQRGGFIFTTDRGTTMDPSRVYKMWSKLLAALGLPPIRLYDCRHTHATQMFEAGAPPKVVQERLGHSNISLTLNTYTHMLPGMDAQAVAALETLYQNARKAG